MTDAGLSPAVSRPVGGASGIPDAVVGLLLAPRTPTAIVTSTDALAAAVYAVAGQRGMRIGSDLAVTGYDGSSIGRTLVPALTTIAVPFAEIGQRVVLRALREIDGPTGEPGEIVRATLIQGMSA
jgi:DNA-binding LacI/PurR family transcriptional regulator